MQMDEQICTPFYIKKNNYQCFPLCCTYMNTESCISPCYCKFLVNSKYFYSDDGTKSTVKMFPLFISIKHTTNINTGTCITPCFYNLTEQTNEFSKHKCAFLLCYCSDISSRNSINWEFNLCTPLYCSQIVEKREKIIDTTYMPCCMYKKLIVSNKTKTQCISPLGCWNHIPSEESPFEGPSRQFMSNICILCLLDSNITYGFDSCGHVCMCSNCGNNPRILEKLHYKCPLCNTSVNCVSHN